MPSGHARSKLLVELEVAKFEVLRHAHSNHKNKGRKAARRLARIKAELSLS